MPQTATVTETETETKENSGQNINNDLRLGSY